MPGFFEKDTASDAQHHHRHWLYREQPAFFAAGKQGDAARKRKRERVQRQRGADAPPLPPRGPKGRWRGTGGPEKPRTVLGAPQTLGQDESGARQQGEQHRKQRHCVESQTGHQQKEQRPNGVRAHQEHKGLPQLHVAEEAQPQQKKRHLARPRGNSGKADCHRVVSPHQHKGRRKALAPTPIASSKYWPGTDASRRARSSTSTSQSALTESSTISKGAPPKQNGAPMSGDGVTPAKKSQAQKNPNPKNRMGKRPSATAVTVEPSPSSLVFR